MIYPIHATEVDLERVSLAERKAAAGPGMRVAWNPLAGWALEAVPGSKWHHPWFTRLRWLPSLNQWVAMVVAGFVNGRAPVVETTAPAAKAAAQQDFGINPLSGLPYFSDPIFNQGGNAPSSSQSSEVDIPLYYNPQIIPAWRNVGFDSLSEAAPQFFKDRGVQDPPPQPTDDELATGATPTLDAQPTPGNRLLRACDIVLHQPRSALTSTITLEPGIVTGVSNVTQTLSLVPADPTDRLKVYAAPQIENLAQAGIDPTTGDYTEPNFDEILVSTVYLLSPPNTPIYSAPDATWTPYARHSLFWNLSYAQPVFFLPLDAAIDAVTSLAQIGSLLATGAAATTVNFQAATINDAYQAAANILQAQSMAGSFWTPTGGGSDSAFPSTPAGASVAPSGNGLDKDGIALASRQQAALATATEQLDPDFPYNSPQFNLALLGQ